MGRRGEDGPRPEGGAAAHPGPAHDHAPGPDERLVLNHDRHRVRRLEHAADADAAGEVDVLADLGGRADGGPGVDHRPGVHVGADVDERGHQHRPRRDVATPPRDRAGQHPHAVQPGLQRDPVVVPEVTHLGAGHRQHPEGQQDGPLGPLVHHHLIGDRVDVRHPGLARVHRVHRGDDGRTRLGVGRGQFGPPLPQLVDHVGEGGR